MYASITLSKTQRPRWFTAESRGLKNPKVIRGEFHPWLIQGQKVLKEPYVTGETITREPRPSYTVRVGESYRQDGKVKSRQKHIYTFDEWAIIDELLDCQERGVEHTLGRYIDPPWYEEQLHKAFPDVDPWKVWPIIEDKLRTLEEPILAGFKKTEEYRWWLETKRLKDQLNAEKAQAQAREKAERRRYEEQSRQQYQEHHQQSFTDRNPSPGVISLSQEETRIIDICYKAMAVQLHPDKCGDPEDMKILNRLKDKIRNGV